MEEKKKSGAVERIALERVPDSERKSWLSIAFIWTGSTICVPALMVGGMIAGGLPFSTATLAIVLGFVIVCIYMYFIGAQGADLGRPTSVIFSRALGERGSGVAVGLVLVIACTGWFAFQTSVCGSAFAMIMKDYFGIGIPLWLSCLIWGVAMFITSVYGVVLIRILNYISVPALIIILVYALIYVFSKPDALADILAYTPETPMPFITGLTLAVSGFAVGAVLSGDFTRYAKSRKDAGLATLVGVLPLGAGTPIIGAILALYAGNYDITVMFSSMGLPIIGLITLILATWTTNTGNAYSAGIALVNVFKLKDDKRALATLVLGAVGTILAIAGVINFLVPFLSFLSAFIPPLAGVIIADYWIQGKGDFKNWKPWAGVNWLGLASWAVGIVVAMKTTFFVPALNGIIASMIVYIILVNVVKSDKVNPFAALKAKASTRQED